MFTHCRLSITKSFLTFSLLSLGLLSLSLLFANPLAANPNPCSTDFDFNHPLSIAELIDISLVNHPETRQAWWNAQRAASVTGSARSAYYPQISLNANATQGRDFKFINGPETTYQIIGADVALSFLLYDFGERDAAVNSAINALIAANWQVDLTFQKVMVGVLENTYATIHAVEVLQADLISLEDAHKMLKIAQDLNQAGLSPISDVYTSKAALSQMKMEVSQKRALLDIQKGKLAASLGISAETSIELAPLPPIMPPQKIQLIELIALARRQRADLMAKRARLDETISNLERVRASYRPKISVAGRGGAEHAFHDHSHGANYQIALRLDIPLFDGFDSMYQKRQAYANTRITSEELAELELSISLEVLTQNRLMEAAEEMMDESSENLLNAQKAYDGVVEKYKSGEERIAEVTNAQRQLAAARVLFSDVRTRWLVSIANLAYATGTLAPYMENPCTD